MIFQHNVIGPLWRTHPVLGAFADDVAVTSVSMTTVCTLPQARAWPQAAAHWLVAGVCVVSALAGRLAYLCRPFDHDAAMFVYLGKSVCDGQRFGHDIIDNKFPSVGLMTSVCWRVFGTNWSGYVLLQTTVAMLTAVVLSRCAARNFGPQARLPTLLAAIVYVNFSVAVFGGFQLETLQMFFAVVAACGAIEAIRHGFRADAVLAGLAAGCAAMFKPTGLAPLGAFALVLMMRKPDLVGIRLLGAAVGGLLIPLGVVAIYMIQTDILRDLPQIIRQISLYASQTPLAWEDIFKPITVLVLAGFPLVVRGWVFRRPSRRLNIPLDRSIAWFVVVWFVLELLGGLMQRRMYAYHFLPIAAPAALLFGMIPRRNEPIPLAAALGPIILLSLLGSVEVLRHPDPNRPILPASAYLLKHARPGDAVWQDSMPRLLLETGLRPGARFPIMFLFGNHDTAALEYTPLLLDDLASRRTRFVILPADLDAKLHSETTQCSHLLRSPVRADNFRKAWRQIEQYVRANYLPAEQMGGQIVYELKE